MLENQLFRKNRKSPNLYFVAYTALCGVNSSLYWFQTTHGLTAILQISWELNNCILQAGKKKGCQTPPAVQTPHLHSDPNRASRTTQKSREMCIHFLQLVLFPLTSLSSFVNFKQGISIFHNGLHTNLHSFYLLERYQLYYTKQQAKMHPDLDGNTTSVF